MRSPLNSIQWEVGHKTLDLNNCSIKQFELINKYVMLVTASRFLLIDAYNEILSSNILRYYHKGIQDQMNTANLTINIGLGIFEENRDELLNDEFINNIDNTTAQLMNLVDTNLQSKPLLKIYQDLASDETSERRGRGTIRNSAKSKRIKP